MKLSTTFLTSIILAIPALTHPFALPAQSWNETKRSESLTPGRWNKRFDNATSLIDMVKRDNLTERSEDIAVNFEISKRDNMTERSLNLTNVFDIVKRDNVTERSENITDRINISKRDNSTKRFDDGEDCLGCSCGPDHW